MRLMITGAGLVGAQIAALEQQAGRWPVLFDLAPRPDALADFVDLDRAEVVRGNVLDPLDLAAAVRDHEVTHIVHTAANPGLTAGAAQDPLAAVRINVLGTANVLEVARRFALKRVVVCSSSALYANVTGGEDNAAPGRENAYPRPSTVYATTKSAAESLALNYHTTLGVETAVVRFASVFGPWRPGGGGLATEAIDGYIRSCRDTGEATVGPLALEWVYSKDAAQGAWRACQATDAAGAVFNIGTGEVLSPADLAHALQAVFPDAKIGLADEQNALSVQAMDPTRAASHLGYQPQYHPITNAFTDYRRWLERL